MRQTMTVLAAAALLGATVPSASAAEPNLQPVIEKMSSETTRDRIAALRDFMRLKPAATKARPVLEKLVGDASPEVRAEVVGAVADLLGSGGTDLLEKLYQDADRIVRDAAIREACRMWDQDRARELCSTAFRDPDPAARVQTLMVLRDNWPRDPRAGELFRKGLGDPAEMVQRSAVFGVQAARDLRAVPELARLAMKGSDLVAAPAAQEALATIGTPEAVQALVTLLPKPAPGQKPSEVVRAAALLALERIRDARSAPAIRALLVKGESATIRVAALSAITALKDKEALSAVTGQLGDPEPRVRQSALRAVRRIGDPSAADRVRQVLREDRDVNVRMSAVNALADLLGPKAIPDIAARRDDLAAEVRMEAAADLAGFGKPAAGALAGFLDDKSPDVRKTAIQGLGQIGGREHIPAIAAAAKEEGKVNAQVRMMSAEALGGIRHADGIPALVGLSKDPEPSVRQAAAAALGQIGGPKALEALQPLLKDQVASVRNAARRATEQAQRTPPAK